MTSILDNNALEPQPVVDGNRISTTAFAQVFRAYLEADKDIQAHIQSMVEVYNNRDECVDTREAALDTLVELLFPSSHNGELGIDLKDNDELQSENTKHMLSAIDRSIEHFTSKVRKLISEKGMSQEELAEKIGVGQSAISMLLNRNCRPQRKTISRIADALGVCPDDLWVE